MRIWAALRRWWRQFQDDTFALHYPQTVSYIERLEAENVRLRALLTRPGDKFLSCCRGPHRYDETCLATDRVRRIDPEASS